MKVKIVKKERLKKEIKEELSEFQKAFKKHLISFITGAFTFVAALLWRDAISSFLEKYQEMIQSAVFVKEMWVTRLITAFAVSLLAVFIIYILSKVLKE